MDFKKNIYFSAVVVLLFSFKGCDGLTCYDCAYVKRGDVLEAGLKGCADPFDSTAIPTLDCNGFCSKTVVERDFETTVTRTCLAARVGCRETTNLRCCDSDYCNGAGGLKQRQVAAWAAIIITCLLTALNIR